MINREIADTQVAQVAAQFELLKPLLAVEPAESYADALVRLQRLPPTAADACRTELMRKALRLLAIQRVLHSGGETSCAASVAHHFHALTQIY